MKPIETTYLAYLYSWENTSSTINSAVIPPPLYNVSAMNKATLLALTMVLASVSQAQTWTKVYEEPWQSSTPTAIKKVTIGPGNNIAPGTATLWLFQQVSGDYYSAPPWSSWLTPLSSNTVSETRTYPKDSSANFNPVYSGEVYEFWMSSSHETAKQVWWNPTQGTFFRERDWATFVDYWDVLP